ncbi:MULTISPECIES: FMN-dependent NADH-azoreductase [unclassified Nostoc]|uniref:FMN-dependent NADH-azoreductase n=1 Tax=unclassified Nostoc TaxID=2593658 RepID=UPI002AD311E9|nr:FMN-dependent NADH-azoreductase [Nostoc sp. DedQUE03]MDZ7975561.1 FMN-dependent NADH-azoreductase [Nostoc sp. DedQUE03]MDZ8048728.1 FMN-dependent NADH-azoreductase [Nostoc sp. DedQUE02]
MGNILHIDSSPRGDRSNSRKLAKEFIAAWQSLHPDDVISYRDLRQTPVPHVTEDWIVACFTPPEALTSEMAELLKFSDELVDEFLAADRCVFSVPMYNFSIPSNFKGYIDQVIRVGRTFTEEDGQVKGLANGKKVLFITSRGVEYGAGSPYEGWDCQEPALRYAFQFMGVTDIEFIHANGLDMGDEVRKRALDKAQSEIQELVNSW